MLGSLLLQLCYNYCGKTFFARIAEDEEEAKL
jgi:hypothetical protein